MNLIAHPGFPPDAVSAVAFDWDPPDERRSGSRTARFTVSGIARLVIPPARAPQRADDLWKTTCFELFFRQSGGAYFELNFSPSGEWAAYAFDSYRAGMRDQAMAAPKVTCETAGDRLVLRVALDTSSLPAAGECNVSAVIEELGGRKSYWAIAHPPGKPDFHDPACFVPELPAPPAP